MDAITSYRPAFSLYVAGGLLILSGLLHAGVHAVLPLEWEGAVSWRKPILFGISTGVTCLSLGWVSERVRRISWVARLLPLTALAAVVEVGLITLQTWRGVASHFNHATTLDFGIAVTIDLLITLITATVLVLTVLSLGKLRRRSVELRGDMALAIRSGMLLLSAACGFGFWMLWYGASRVELGHDPGVYGEAGVLKFVHGMPIHAIQILPLTSWALMRLGFPFELRYRGVVSALVVVLALSAYAVVQTFAGRARVDIGVPGFVTLISGFGVAVAILCCQPRRSNDRT